MLGLNVLARLAAGGALLATAAVGLPGPAAGTPLDAARATAPRQGQYVGETRQEREATLYVGRRVIRSAVFEVDCGIGSGRMKLGRVKLRNTPRGFAFESRRRRRVTYDDGHRPETATVVISGRFGRTGRKALGTVRVRSRHCGGSGKVRWSAAYSATPVRAPKSGRYTGPTEQRRELSLFVSGASIELAAIEFQCGEAIGHTVLNDVDMRRTRRGFSFAIRAHGSVDYSDEYPGENAPIEISGTFARSGSNARGRLSVNTPRCGRTGQVSWTVKRSNGS
jgi:carbon monoxide dehydrogenase subunit G